MVQKRVVILGAAGRDFHNFNVLFRENPDVEVVAFTAAQIPGIEGRRYPPDLAGRYYPEGIPILPESSLGRLIAQKRVDEVVFSYSDVSHDDVMHKASLAVAKGADFRLLSARSTMLRSTKPVISLCAVRTGSGKSPAARRIASLLKEEGLRVAIVRHPMPYGDLSGQAFQRFASPADLAAAACTIEEREEYEPHLRAGNVVFAGVDYERILRRAEEEADVLLWDGGNNDTPFFEPNLEVVLLDPHRAGHERRYYPGEVNFLRADVFLITKVDSADAASVEAVLQSAKAFNPMAEVILSAMPVTTDAPEAIRGKRVLVIEDGPTLTHGGMASGAGAIAARKWGALATVDPRPYAVGGIAEAFSRYPHLGQGLPALGYGSSQIRDLEETIRRVPCDLVLVATPVDLRKLIRIEQATARVSYELEDVGSPGLKDILQAFVGRLDRQGALP
jgi:predicted GTPase